MGGRLGNDRLSRGFKVAAAAAASAAVAVSSAVASAANATI